jgi:zinc transporter ZupT
MIPDASGTLPTGGVWWPLLLSTFAGLSTSIGGLIAINLSPGESTLAFLLGSAVGVMSTVSIAELWVHKAVEHSNWLGISIAVAAGGVVFAVLDPLLPKPVEPHTLLQQKTSQQVCRLQHAALELEVTPRYKLVHGFRRVC